jgi:RHS repeat-associated protein
MRTSPLRALVPAAGALLLALPLQAQLGTSRPSFSAPEAASLGKFGEVPVGLYTGAPDISIPLFTAQGRTLSLPVTLKYQSGGIRLDDIGSWVGMGWTLEAGGVITRSVRGNPDDAEHGYWNTGHVFYNDANWPRPSPPGIPAVNFLENIRGGWIDGEPDQFFFNFAGRTGQFVIGPTSASSTSKEVRTIPHQKLRIVPSANFTSWAVTTEDGTRYTFAAVDSTLDLGGTSSANSGYAAIYRPKFISAWHLTEVRAPGGDVIRLHYSRYTARHTLTPGGARILVLNNHSCFGLTDSNQFNDQEFTISRLDSITSAAHTLRFVIDPVLRADALSPSGARQEPRLSAVVVATPGGTVIRRFEFDHDYFGGNRLRLKNVFEADAAGNRLAPWSFEYDPQSFPARGSFAQDHGGYWNGKANGELVPAATGSWTWPDGTHTRYMPGADRTPVTSYMRVGTLTRITYPTGGFTRFTWEGHDYGRTILGGQTVTDSVGPQQNASAASVTTGGPRVVTTSFTVSSQVPSVTFVVSVYCPLGMSPCPTVRANGPGFDSTFTTTGSRTFALAPGTYQLTATSPVTTTFASGSITAQWYEVFQIIGRKPGSGLRIREVRTDDGHGGQDVRKYRYRLQSDSTRSSGLVEYEPVYLEHAYTGEANAYCEYFVRTATPVTPLGASTSLAYREVTVSHGENGELGTTRATFRNPYDNPDGAPQIPRPNLRMTAYDWRRGQQLSSAEYNAAGQVQQRTAARYSFQMNDPATSRRFRGMSLSRFSTTENFYGWNPFEVVSEWFYLASDTTYSYDGAGALSVSSARGWNYGNPVHLQPTQLTETNSDGTQRITRMRYPADYADGMLTNDPGGIEGGPEGWAHALTMMKDSVHVHSPVVERWVSEVVGGSERVLEAELTLYNSWVTAAGRSYLPMMRWALHMPGPVTDFTPTTVVNQSLLFDESRYQLVEQQNGYDAYGRIRELGDASNGTSTYTYGGNANNAFLSQIRRVDGRDISPTVLLTQLGYDGSGNLSSLRDEDGTLRTFTYDGWGRLRQVRDHAGTLLRGIGYAYSRTAANGWTYQPGAPNAVIDTTYLQQTPSVARVVSTGYVDGLGRSIQTVAEDGASYHVSARQYDASGHAWRLWKPYTRSAPGFDSNFAANATSFHNTDLGVTNARPYTDSLFTADALRRPASVIPAYVGTAPTALVSFAYGVDAATGRRYTETTDEAGKKTRVYVDGFGNPVRTVLGYGTAEATTAQLAFNALGQRTQLTDPRGIVTGYTLNTRGMLTSRTNPDAGNRSQKFNRAGSLRYHQDANQAVAGQVFFTSYDFADRPLVSGQGAAAFASLDPDASDPPTLETNTAHWRTVRHYDAKPSTTAFPWSLFAAQFGGLTLSNVSGRLAAVASKSNGAWQAEFYSYDADGQVATRYTFTQANGGGSVWAALNTTVGYARNLSGTITQRSLTVGSGTLHQWYDYDGRGLLARVYSNTVNSKPAQPDAAYTYRAGGAVRERQFLGGPVVPLRYTIREQLAQIGDPASTLYPFSARYSYHPNGRMLEAEFYNAGSPAANKRYGYVFGAASWDALNRLRSADFSEFNGAGWTTTAANDLTGIYYDASGNLTALGRYQQTGTLVDNLGYSYYAGFNRLVWVNDNAGATAESWDAETGAFGYDLNGNLTSAPAPYSITAATYDFQNLPLSFTVGGVTTTYRYNGEGQRIAKQVGGGDVEVYIKEGPTTLGYVTLTPAGALSVWRFNLLADDQVIGRHTNPPFNQHKYYYRDLLGSIRSVTWNGAVTESYDYDPWGVLIPGRTLAGPTFEGFSGKQLDAETGLHYFGARYYMAALGRWTSVDPPADTFPSWSPYNYVENNPTGSLDPYGLRPLDDESDEFGCCRRRVHQTPYMRHRFTRGSLAQHEGRKGIDGEPGHTLSRHVNVDRAFIRARARETARRRAPDGSKVAEASRFTNQRTAEDAVREVLMRNQVKVEEWERNPTRLNDPLVLTEYIGRPVGQVARSNGRWTRVEPTSWATVVLRHDPQLGFRVETAFAGQR